MGKVTRIAKNPQQKRMMELYDSLCYRHSRWEVWSDFVSMSAISIANAVCKDYAEQREKLYLQTVKKYTKEEVEHFVEMFAELVRGMEVDPNQDFLGDLFMNLGLSNDHNGQFFTPYHLCDFMAHVVDEGIDAEIEKQGWIGVNDPACGAGALLVAFANHCRKMDINFQEHVLFVAQDIDYIVALMCYLQLSLLGCPGYIVVGNSLSNPATSIDDRGLIPVPSENVWYTPLYFSPVWEYRKIIAMMRLKEKADRKKTEAESAPPDEEQAHEEPKDAAEEPKEAAPVLPTFNETKNGQLTLF